MDVNFLLNRAEVVITNFFKKNDDLIIFSLVASTVGRQNGEPGRTFKMENNADSHFSRRGRVARRRILKPNSRQNAKLLRDAGIPPKKRVNKESRNIFAGIISLFRYISS